MSEPKVRVTIEWLEPDSNGNAVPPAVLEFDTFEIKQDRPVHRVFPSEDGPSELVPDPTTMTVIRGTRTAG